MIRTEMRWGSKIEPRQAQALCTSSQRYAKDRYSMSIHKQSLPIPVAGFSDKVWTTETTTFFCVRLAEMAAILSILISNVSEYSKDDGHATNEALVLANQVLLSTCGELEHLSYEYMISPQVNVGKLSLYLMWARSLLQITDGMFHADSWEVKCTDKTLFGYFGAIKRQVDSAIHESSNMRLQETK